MNLIRNVRIEKMRRSAVGTSGPDSGPSPRLGETVILRRSTTIAAAIVGIALMAAPSAMASTSSNGTFRSTCDASDEYASNYSYYSHSAKGKIKVQNLSVYSVRQRVYSSAGNPTSASVKTAGGTSSWSDVLKGRYRVAAKVSKDYNCNGILPGEGTFTYQYKITY